MNTLKKAGYNVVQMWEHDFDEKYRTDDEYRKTVESFWPHREPIKPREALFVGRTNAIKLYHEVKENEEIKYIDICPLYPYVCKYGNIRDYTGL